MSDTNVIDFEKGRTAVSGGGSAQAETWFRRAGTQVGPTPAFHNPRKRLEGATALAPISIDTLYPPSEEAKEDISNAIALLAKAVEVLGEARAASNPLTADRHVQRFQVMLPELFRYRSVGDGYGSIINSLHFSFINLHGKTLSPEQTTLVWRILKELRTRPFLSFDVALGYVDELGRAQFQVDPSILGELVEDSDDE